MNLPRERRGARRAPRGDFFYAIPPRKTEKSLKKISSGPDRGKFRDSGFWGLGWDPEPGKPGTPTPARPPKRPNPSPNTKIGNFFYTGELLHLAMGILKMGQLLIHV